MEIIFLVMISKLSSKPNSKKYFWVAKMITFTSETISTDHTSFLKNLVDCTCTKAIVGEGNHFFFIASREVVLVDEGVVEKCSLVGIDSHVWTFTEHQSKRNWKFNYHSNICFQICWWNITSDGNITSLFCESVSPTKCEFISADWKATILKKKLTAFDE